MSAPDIVLDEMRRTCLELEVHHPGLRSLMFTAPMGGEGTTTVASLYARVLAAVSDAKVVLVDANLDAPGVHARFGVGMEPGLRDWDPENPERGLVAWRDDPRVSVLPAGRGTATLYSLQASGRLNRLAAQLRQGFAYVLWDVPPMNLHPEARLLLAHVDGVLAVVESDATKLEALVEFGGVVTRSGAPLLGAIMNRSGRYSFDSRPPGRRLRLTGS